jgi:hypothetical protein
VKKANIDPHGPSASKIKGETAAQISQKAKEVSSVEAFHVRQGLARYIYV